MHYTVKSQNNPLSLSHLLLGSLAIGTTTSFFFWFPSLSRAVRKTATCTQIHQHRNKKRIKHDASDTGDAAIKASATLETPPSTFTTQH